MTPALAAFIAVIGTLLFLTLFGFLIEAAEE